MNAFLQFLQHAATLAVQGLLEMGYTFGYPVPRYAQGYSGATDQRHFSIQGMCRNSPAHLNQKAMKSFATVLLGLIGLTSKALVEKGRNCVDMLTGNAAFTLPAGFLASITTACNVLEQANEEVLFFGGKVNYEAKRVAEGVLSDLIRELAGYVQAQSGGDATLILSAGFNYRKKAGPVEKLAQVANLRSEATKFQGTADLRWNVVRSAQNYLVMRNAVNPDQEDAWELVGYTSRASLVVTSLDSAKYYWFRVQAIGRKGLLSPMSEVIKVLAA